VRRLAVAAVAAAALVAAACGGGGAGGGSLPDGAGLAPREAPAFVSLNTDFSSERWKNLTKLAARFPATPVLLERLRKETPAVDFERDVKPALGRELDLVWLDLANGGTNVVGLTKPDTKAKLQALLRKLTANDDAGLVTAQVDDWIAVADSQAKLDRFRELAGGDKLDGDDGFRESMGKEDADASVRAWVRGGVVQAALDRALVSGGAAARPTHEIGDLRALAGSARAKGEGVSMELDGLLDPEQDPATFSPSLQDAVPGEALLYVSTTSLDAPTRMILRLVGKSVPKFEQQLEQVQGVLGIRLDDDIYPLLKGESALAVYRGGRIPPILFLQKVDDERKADGLLRRLSAIAQLSGQVRAETVRIADKNVQKLTFASAGVTIWDGVADGKIFATNAAELAQQAVAGPADSLGEDELFRSAHDAAELPDEVAAFAYGDLKNGLPFVFQLARQSGSVIPPAAVENTKPLETALVYLVKDGEALRMSGFTTIK
jgi:hypothetical protein